MPGLSRLADSDGWSREVLILLDGGAEGIRTPDPHNAIVVLYQLSYDPILQKRGKVRITGSKVKK